MATKKTSIADLEQQYLEAEKNFHLRREQFEAAKKEEEEVKRVKLAEEKQKRYGAVMDAYEEFEKLKTEYINDYGCFSFESTTSSGDKRGLYIKPIVWL